MKTIINKILPSSKVKKDIKFNYNTCDNLEPIQLHDLSLIAPVKKHILKFRTENKNINIIRSFKKMSLIIPYRHREEHLAKFIPHLKKYLKNKNIEHEIIVVEQDDKESFNKAKLMNIGALNASDTSEYFVFHDVDLLPENIDYRYSNHTQKLFKFIKEDGDFKEYGPTIFGGAILVPKNIFIDINGFSNSYLQWGKEDDDFLLRHLLKGYIPLMDTNGKLIALPHQPTIKRDVDGSYVSDKEILSKNKRMYKKNKTIFSNLKRGISNQDLDGLSSVNNYTITSITENDNVKTIKVSFSKEKINE